MKILVARLDSLVCGEERTRACTRERARERAHAPARASRGGSLEGERETDHSRGVLAFFRLLLSRRKNSPLWRIEREERRAHIESDLVSEFSK